MDLFQSLALCILIKSPGMSSLSICLQLKWPMFVCFCKNQELCKHVGDTLTGSLVIPVCSRRIVPCTPKLRVSTLPPSYTCGSLYAKQWYEARFMTLCSVMYHVEIKAPVFSPQSSCLSACRYSPLSSLGSSWWKWKIRSAFLSLPGTVFVQSFFMKKTWYVNCGDTPGSIRNSLPTNM